jgi:hypothetical protein
VADQVVVVELTTVRQVALGLLDKVMLVALQFQIIQFIQMAVVAAGVVLLAGHLLLVLMVVLEQYLL